MPRPLALALVVVLAGCHLIEISTPNTSTVVVVPPSPAATAAPTPAPSVGCPRVASVQLGSGACGNGITVGSICEGLSATPFLAPGVPSPAACDDSRSVNWVSGIVCQVIVGGRFYNPDLRGMAPGTCLVTVEVDGVRSNTVTITVSAP